MPLLHTRAPTQPFAAHVGSTLAEHCMPSTCPLCVDTVSLDAAGKTTILYRLQLGEKIESIPTIGTPLSTHTAIHDNNQAA